MTKSRRCDRPSLSASVDPALDPTLHDFGSNQLAQLALGAEGPTESPFHFVDLPEANGCGPAWSPSLAAAGNALLPMFRSSCDTHDVGDERDPGYATLGASKSEADLAFLKNLHDQCAATFPVDTPLGAAQNATAHGLCDLAALGLTATVALGGHGAYADGQAEAQAAHDGLHPGPDVCFDYGLDAL